MYSTTYNISEVGSRTFVQSDEFGERFVDWTIGDMWTSEYIIVPAKAKDVVVAVAESRGINGGDSPFFDRRLNSDSVNEEEGTTILLTLAQNSPSPYRVCIGILTQPRMNCLPFLWTN